MIKTTKKGFRRIAFLLTFALLITSIAGIGNVNKAQAAVTTSGIIYDSYGEISKTLLNGKSANVSVDNGILDLKVDGEKYGYYDTSVVGSCVISDDDLLHIIWHTGEYYVYDLYESGRFILAGYKSVSGSKISYYAASYGDKDIVYGSSAANASFHSSIIDKKYFYMYGKVGKKLLMTREEFNRIVDGDDLQPTATPTVEPTATPSNNCGCKDGGKCTCPAGQCKCDNCNCGPTASCQPTATPIQTPGNNGGCKGNCGCGCGSNCNDTCCGGNCSCKKDSNSNSNNSNSGNINVNGNNNTIIINGNNNSVNGGNNSSNGGSNGKANANCSKATKTKSKITYHVRRSSKYVSLTRTVNGKTGIICKVRFNKKTGVAKFDGITYRGIKYVSYTSTSRQIIFRTSKGKIKIIPRAKGKVNKTYKAKTLKGKWKKCIEDTRGLTLRVSDGKKKVMGVKTAQPKKIKG